jgi:hypothetical protein
LRKGELVTPAVPRILHPLTTLASASRTDDGTVAKGPAADSDSDGRTQPANRLDFAHWLVDRSNPLTARVTVNRLWQNYFGRGIVETENDFGTQGSRPTHPELLDWLAVEFMEQGWSLKVVHKLIVTSATYRQSSHARPELDTVDADNRLLARQQRLRLEAEVVRDMTLAASGTLSRVIGGPSVFPPQPEGVYRFTQSDKNWRASTGGDRYRRGMYIHFWRSAPYPALTVFDAPSSTTTCTRRIRSNTPLQALTVLNDQAFYEIAQAVARRVMANESGGDERRLQLAFRLCLSREPSQIERERLAELVASERLDAHGDAAAKELAAWTAVARVLTNLDEFITRE